MSTFAAIILEIAIDKPLDYAVPDQLLPLLQPGVKVEVPVRGKMQSGYILALKNETDYPNVKPISRLLSEEGSIPSDLFQLALWVSNYYCAPLRDVFRMILPPSVRKGMKPKMQLFVTRAKTREEFREACIKWREKYPAQVAILEHLLPVTKGMFLSKLLEESKVSRSAVESLAKKGYLSLSEVKVERSPFVDEEYFMTPPKKMNPDQANALEKIQQSLNTSQFAPHLLYGVTGSGKTEVYLQAIAHALEANKGTIMLVPEISLTTQTIERFKSRFTEKIAILHHRLSEGERTDEWEHIRSGRAMIVIGARSAIFSPVSNLGLIIVDEEHESSYKQNEISPCYQARDVAVMRAKLTKSTIILGSATPSLESYYNAQKGKYQLSVLKNRAEINALPSVKIVDMKKEYDKAKGRTNFSELLLNQIEKRMKNGEQTILFLNRRGYHTLLLCQACENTIKCAHCDISLTFHMGENRLGCHLCGYEIKPPPKTCPSCQADQPLKFRGAGTELIERSLHAIFPDIKTLRLDADTTKHKGSHQKLLREFGTGKADVLIGTQMIAKGLHFPEVTLVGILNSDVGLHTPDFRASETVFQLITQVAGRAGRGALPGEVIIQTTVPEHSTICYAANQDFEGFYKEEIGVRELFNYPPFSHIAKIVISGKCPKRTFAVGENIRQALIRFLPNAFEFHPVVPSGHSKVKDLYRFQFLLKGPSMHLLKGAIERVKTLELIRPPHRLFVDINPSSTYF